MKTHLSPRDLALTLAVVALWGYTFVPIKIALAEVPPFALAALRFLFAAVPMVFFVRPPAMPWRNVVAYGFAIGVFQFGLLFLGIKLGMPAGLSSIVIQVQVFFTIGLAVAFAGDRLQPAQRSLGARDRRRRHRRARRAQARAADWRGTLVGFVLVVAAAFAWARRQHHRQARRRRSRRRHVRARRVVEPRAAAAARRAVVRVRRRPGGVARARSRR